MHLCVQGPLGGAYLRVSKWEVDGFGETVLWYVAIVFVLNSFTLFHKEWVNWTSGLSLGVYGEVFTC
jgi:hypothetical protein